MTVGFDDKRKVLQELSGYCSSGYILPSRRQLLTVFIQLSKSNIDHLKHFNAKLL